MSSTQTLLTIGAMLILALVAMRFNSAMVSTQSTDLSNKVYLTAFSLADNIIEEAKVKSFDQTTLHFPTTNPATLSYRLGIDTTIITTKTPPDTIIDAYPNFNDVDDFSGFKETITAPYFETYYIDCYVHYVSATNQDQISATQTFYKKLTVTVRSPYLTSPDSVSLSYIFTLK